MAKKRMPYRAYINMAKSYIACCHKDNATVIPDGATVPLPASVRRVMRHLPAIKDALHCEAAHHFADCRDAPDPRCPTCMALKAVKAHERAVAKEGVLG